LKSQFLIDKFEEEWLQSQLFKNIFIHFINFK
jgi:hypothetical protein